MDPTLPAWDDSQTIAKSKITLRASLRILERYPIDDDNDDDVFSLFDADETAGGDAAALFQLCRLLLKTWRYVLFFQPRREKLVDALREHAFPDAVVKGILEAYAADAFLLLVERLATCTLSGVPRVHSTDLTSRTVATRNSRETRQREALLTFSTDRGAREVLLSSGELEKLYWAVGEVQKSLDNLLERR